MSEKLIKKLLAGKPLTGEEAGKIIIYASAKDLELQLSEKEGKVFFPQEQMQDCINSLDSEQTSIFNRYVSINNFIRYAYNTCLGHKEIALNRLTAIETTIADIAGYANRVRLFNRLPAIFTETQIADILQEAEKEFNGWKYELIDVICAFIGHQTRLMDDNKADIRFNKIMADYKACVIPEPLREVVNLIWCDYEQYIIKDAPYPLETKEDLINALRYRNIQPLKKYTEKELKQPLTFDYIKKMLPEPELEQIVIKQFVGEAKKIHTLYDFLTNITFKDVNTIKENDISLKGILEEHFKDLYDYALNEVLNIKGLEVFKSNKDAVITLPELARKNILGYDRFYNEQIAKKYGYNNRGVAILHTLWNVKPCDIDDKGHYRCSMDATTYDDLARLVHRIYENRTDNSSIYCGQLNWPVAFNIIIDIMIDAYGVKELETYKIDLSSVEDIISSINRRIKDLLLYKFMPIDMGRVNDAEQKLYTVREEFLQTFPYINYKNFEPAKEDLEATETFIKDLKSFATLGPSLMPFYILYGGRK